MTGYYKDGKLADSKNVAMEKYARQSLTDCNKSEKKQARSYRFVLPKALKVENSWLHNFIPTPVLIPGTMG